MVIDNLKRDILYVLENSPGKKAREIARELSVDRRSVSRYLHEHDGTLFCQDEKFQWHRLDACGERVAAIEERAENNYQSKGSGPSIQTLGDRLRNLKVWNRANERAVHKPLLVLLAISRCLHGHPRFSAYVELESKLSDLLISFGRPTTSVHPEYPFWRLQNDGVWTVHADVELTELTTRKGQTDPKKSELRKSNARGGFSEDIFLYFARFPLQAMSLAEDVLRENFASSDHAKLRKAVRLPISIVQLPHYCDTSLLQLIERAEVNATSTRLCNAMKLATEKRRISILTVADYLQETDPDTDFLRLPNVGKNCVRLLGDIVAQFLEDDARQRNADPYLARKGRSDTDDLAKEKSPVEVVTKPESFNTKSLENGLWRAITQVLKSPGLDVLKMRFEDGQTLEEAGTQLGVTRERVRQIQNREIRKLCGAFKNDLKSVAQRTDRMLDEHLGIISFTNFYSIFSPARENTNLFVAMLQGELNEEVKVDKQSMIYRRSTEQNWKSWSKEVVDTVISAPWPITVEHLLRTIEAIPNAFIGYVLRQRLGATISDGKLARIDKLNETQKLIFCLRSLRRNAHVDEIAHVYRDLFGESILPRNVGAVLQRLSEALIVSRGHYCLYEHLWFDEEQVAAISNKCVSYLRSKDHYISSAVICDELFADKYVPDKMNKYVLLGIMQDDERFITRRGFMVALSEKAEHISFRALDAAVYETVRDNGPIGVADIRRALKGRRRLLDVTISMFIAKDGRIVKLPGSKFDLADRVFCGETERADFEDAIRLCLLDGPRTVFAVASMLARNDALGQTGICPEIVSSVSQHLRDLDRIGDRLSISSLEGPIRSYKERLSNGELADADEQMLRYKLLDSREPHAEGASPVQPESIRSILESFEED